MRVVLRRASLWSRDRGDDVTTASVVFLVGPLLAPLVCLCPPPLRFYRRHGARWKLAGAQLHVFSLTSENDPPAGFFIPGRWPSIVAVYPSGDVASSGQSQQRPSARFCPEHRLTHWGLSVTGLRLTQD